VGSNGLASATRFLVIALGLLYALAAVGGLALVEFEHTRDIVLWTTFLAVGAALLLAGQLLVRPGALSALLISVGAVVGGLPLFWTLLVPIAAAAVVACSIALARRGAAPA
jgi:uncharacterized membrane protein